MKQGPINLGHQWDPYMDVCKVCGWTGGEIVQAQVTCEEARRGNVVHRAFKMVNGSTLIVTGDRPAWSGTTDEFLQ